MISGLKFHDLSYVAQLSAAIMDITNIVDMPMKGKVLVAK